MSQTNEVLLNVELDAGDAVVGTEANQGLHLLLGGQPLGLQVHGQAGQEADPAGGVGPQVIVLPVAVLGQFSIQLSIKNILNQNLIYSHQNVFHLLIVLTDCKELVSSFGNNGRSIFDAARSVDSL